MVTRRGYFPARNVAQQGYFIAEVLIVLGIMSLITLLAVIGTPELFKSKRPYAKVRPVGAVRKVHASAGSHQPSYGRDWSPVSAGQLQSGDSCRASTDETCPPNSLQRAQKLDLRSGEMATTHRPQ